MGKVKAMIEHIIELFVAGVISYILALKYLLVDRTEKLEKLQAKEEVDAIKKNVQAMPDDVLNHDLSDHIDGTGD